MKSLVKVNTKRGATRDPFAELSEGLDAPLKRGTERERSELGGGV